MLDQQSEVLRTVTNVDSFHRSSPSVSESIAAGRSHCVMIESVLVSFPKSAAGEFSVEKASPAPGISMLITVAAILRFVATSDDRRRPTLRLPSVSTTERRRSSRRSALRRPHNDTKTQIISKASSVPMAMAAVTPCEIASLSSVDNWITGTVGVVVASP